MSKISFFKNALSGNRVIGVASPFFWTNKWVDTLRGIDDAAKKNNINLLLFQGIYFNKLKNDFNAFTEEPLNSPIFRILSNCKIDGIIMNTSFLGVKQYKERLLDGCLQFRNIPIVNIGSELPGVCNSLIDNDMGIRQLMNHLINNHGIKEIGFIRGPIGHIDTEERLCTYKKTLSENNILLTDAYISAPVSFEIDNGGVAVEQVLKATDYKVKAFICCSDGLARGAIRYLNTMGLRVPEDIVVTGFNNDFNSIASMPEITSINLKLYDRGWNAVQVIVDNWKSGTLPSKIVSGTSLVVRRSCGCFTTAVNATNKLFNEKSDSIVDIDKIAESMANAIYHNSDIIDKDFILALSSNIVKNYFEQLENPSQETFLPGLIALIHDFTKRSIQVDSLHWGINCLEQRIDCLSDNDQKDFAHSLIDSSRIAICDVDELVKKLYRIKISEHNAKISSLSLSFTNSNNFKNVLQLLEHELPAVGVSSCYLSLYEDFTNNIDNSRLYLAFNKNTSNIIPETGIPFETNKLLPDSISLSDDSRMMVLEPLFYGKHQLGIALIEFEAYTNHQFSQLPAQLSTAIWNGYLWRKEEKNQDILARQAEELLMKNSELTEKSIQIETAYNQLQKNQKKLLYAEKLVAQGQLTAIVAHELNTPLASVGAALLELKQLVDEYKMSIDDPDVNVEDHVEIAADLLNAAKLAESSLNSAIEFTMSIFSAGNLQSGNTCVNVITIINNAVSFLDESIKKAGVEVIINKDRESCTVDGSAERLMQVFISLIANAIESVSMCESKCIEILITHSQSNVLISIRDNGVGIAKEKLSSLFDPRFSISSTDNNVGIGFSTVYNIISQEFSGSLDIKSEIGIGTSILIQIPLV